ncbi:hypothetical protein V8B55DRAFT_1579382 [Mucor lusitanicus]|uniref:Peptidase A1 domain-containing protein n=2 Tax=Mucor circinelloides f. lusitanicus TaxID=29924 RepID=A0A168N4H3_MUCCL|nr:hypothetical protein FB192DRAFT_1344363 [Mucor lusitanicus]OAD05768.1 hypothetical protein MUCCIDRAFT_159480 [Mucor lusitanicus CBS 277.49]
MPLGLSGSKRMNLQEIRLWWMACLVWPFPTLSASNNSNNKTTSFVQELHSQADDHNKQGEVMFGGVNDNYFNGPLAYYIPVEQQSFWKVPVRDVSVNGQQI